MPTAATTLVQRVRRYVRDWPELDVLTASQATSGAMTVASGALYAPNWLVEVDQELERVTATAATSVTVARAQRGTTAASHASGAAVLIRPEFSAIEILDALNAGVSAMFPYVYQPVLDTSLSTTAATYEYTVPELFTGLRIPYISAVELKLSGETDYRPVRAWEVKRGGTPKLKFRRETAGGATIRLSGYGPFAPLTFSDSLHALFPVNAESLLTEFAGQWLLASGEAGRVRSDTQAVDNREQANRTGSSLQASNAILNRFRDRLLNSAAMPPMPRHVKATF